MKFEKFVKTLGTNGVIYKRSNGEKWLASHSVMMLIPEDVQSLMGEKIFDMSEGIETIINCAELGLPCWLYKAIMPMPNGAIKDCIRVYATENEQCQLAISNDDYKLIEKSDVLEIYSRWNKEERRDEAIVLVIKHYPPTAADEPTLVGIVFPTSMDEI